jgi:hypothetical protein
MIYRHCLRRSFSRFLTKAAIATSDAHTEVAAAGHEGFKGDYVSELDAQPAMDITRGGTAEADLH